MPSVIDYAPEHIEAAAPVDMRIKGRWVKVPTLRVDEDILICHGKWLKIAQVRGEDFRAQAVANPERLCAALKSASGRRLRADIFTFSQALPDTYPRYSFPTEWESVAAIALSTFDEWWRALPQETRKNVRRAEKRHVQVRVSEFNDEVVDGIRTVNNESPLRQGRRNAYYGQSVAQTRQRYGEFVGRCDFICAYVGSQMVGFLHLVYREKTAAILNLTTMRCHFDKRPANALMAKAVEICCARGFTHLTYGLYNYGNKQDHPLRDFKIRNGFIEILLPRYYVPLTQWGRCCMIVKLHRGLIGLLPHSVITIAVRSRTLWHQMMLKMSRCSSMTERPNCNRQMESSNPPAGSTVSSDG